MGVVPKLCYKVEVALNKSPFLAQNLHVEDLFVPLDLSTQYICSNLLQTTCRDQWEAVQGLEQE